MSDNVSKEQIDLPLLPLRDVVVFPHMVIPLFVGRPKSIKALDTSMESGKPITAEQPKARPALTIQADDALNVLIIAARTDALHRAREDQLIHTVRLTAHHTADQKERHRNDI